MTYVRLWVASVALIVGVVGCGKQEPARPEANGGGGAKTGTTEQVAGGTRPAAVPGQTCTWQGAKATGPIKIAVIPKGATHEFWKAMHAGALKAEAELKDVEVVWKGPLRESDRSDQINIVENFITAKVTGIALAPLDDVALVRPMRDAVKAGIGVVVMDSDVQADLCKDYASFVATDNYAGGCRGAERLGAILGGKGKIIMLRYDIGSASTAQREQGFLDTMKAKFPNVEILSSDQRGGSTTETAFAKAETLLNKYKDIQGIFTPNESTTFGMLRAVQEAGLEGEVKFVGFDSSEKLIQAMAEKHLHGLVVQNPMNMGYQGVRTLVAYLRGEPVPARIDTGSVVATPENMNEPAIAELLRPPVEKYLAP